MAGARRGEELGNLSDISKRASKTSPRPLDEGLRCLPAHTVIIDIMLSNQTFAEFTARITNVLSRPPALMNGIGASPDPARRVGVGGRGPGSGSSMHMQLETETSMPREVKY